MQYPVLIDILTKLQELFPEAQIESIREKMLYESSGQLTGYTFILLFPESSKLIDFSQIAEKLLTKFNSSYVEELRREFTSQIQTNGIWEAVIKVELCIVEEVKE